MNILKNFKDAETASFNEKKVAEKVKYFKMYKQLKNKSHNRNVLKERNLLMYKLMK